MAITQPRPVELTTGEEPEHEGPYGGLARPSSLTGWKSWLTTVDHKKIGIMYGASALFFFFVGGVEALLMRTQLAVPNNTFLEAELYNQLFTMHGATMIFLVVMPLGAAFMNYFIPLQIGTRDVAFPRLNALSFWVLLSGGVLLNSSWFLAQPPDAGWTNYAPVNLVAYSPSMGIDFWNVGLMLTGVGSLIGSVNLITTCLNMRAPGMSLMKMPVFTWMSLVTQFLILFAIPVLTVAQFLLLFDRQFGANFFNVEAGADPLLWQHLFWIFGHPEVYLMILPAFGIVSEIMPVFARKPLFGYPFMVFSGVAIGFMGWGVWAHHMFASGLGPVSVAAFALSTMFIAVPTGVKIFNWVGTLWGGKLTFTTPMLFSIGLVTQFTVGGLSGVMHSVAPHDTQQHDTYFIVAHFHYVLFGGALFGFIGGLYYWWPKVFGHMLDEKLGKWHFWGMVIGFNLTFFPMHLLGLEGMPRRYYRYDEGVGLDFWNLAATAGSYLLGASFLILAWNILRSRKKGERVGDDPWDGRTLEWTTSSPPPPYNFLVEPEVRHLDDFWYRKYREDEQGRLVRVAATEDVVEHHAGESAAEQAETAESIHLPSPSYWPIVLAFGLLLVMYGLLYTYALTAVGAAFAVVAMFGWSLEPSVAPGHHGGAHGSHDGDHHDPEPEPEPAGAAG